MIPTTRRLGLLLIASATVGFSGNAVADDVTVDGLLQKVPVLSPTNQALQSFHFTAELPTPFGFPALFEVGWTRPDDFGFVLVDQTRTPVLFIAQKQLLLYDASKGTITWDDDAWPNVVLQADDGRWNAKYGFAGKDEVRFIVDLPSLIRGAHASPKLKKLNATTWEVSLLSESGKLETAALFEPSEEWPLRKMVIRNVEDGTSIVSISEISINQPIPKQLMTFPAVERISKEITTRRFSDREVETDGDGVAVVIQMMRALAAPAAIRDDKLQNIPFWKDVNWAEAARRHRRIGPMLAELLQLPLTDRGSGDRVPK